MAYTIKNNEIAWAPAVENINRGYAINGVGTDNTLKVETYSAMNIHIQNGGDAWVNDTKVTWLPATQDDFETGLIDSWNAAARSAISIEPSVVYEGTKSLKWIYTDNGVDQFNNRIKKAFNVADPNGVDFSMRTKLIFYFRPAQTMQDVLYVKYKNNGTEFTLGTVAVASLPVNTWTKIEMSLPSSLLQKNKFQELIFELDGFLWATGTYTFYLDKIQFDTVLTIATADPNNERKDLIVLNSDKTVSIIQGTPQSQQPVEPPDLPYGQVGLAIITISASASQISAANIFDIRVINTFAVNNVKTKNELSSIKKSIVESEMHALTQDLLLGLETDVPHDNLVVEHLVGGSKGLNNTIQTVTSGVYSGYGYEMTDLPRGIVTITGTTENVKSVAFMWKGYLYSARADSPTSASAYSRRIYKIDPVSGAVITDYNLQPSGASDYRYLYSENGNTYMAYHQWWTDGVFLYVPIRMYAAAYGDWSTVFLKFDENLNLMGTVDPALNTHFRCFYEIAQIWFDGEKKRIYILGGGAAEDAATQYKGIWEYDEDWNLVAEYQLDTNYYVIGFGDMPDANLLYVGFWYQASSYTPIIYQFERALVLNGQVQPLRYRNSNQIAVGGAVVGANDNYPKPCRGIGVSNQKDRVWMFYRSNNNNIWCWYFQNGLYSGWYKNYDDATALNRRGVNLGTDSNIYGSWYQAFAKYKGNQAFFCYNNKVYRMTDFSKDAEYAGRYGVTMVGNDSIVSFDESTLTIKFTDLSNATTGRSQSGFDVTTQTLSFSGTVGIYLAAIFDGRGTPVLKYDIQDENGNAVTGLTGKSANAYVVFPTAMDKFKVRIYWTPDGTANIHGFFKSFGLFIDRQ